MKITDRTNKQSRKTDKSEIYLFYEIGNINKKKSIKNYIVEFLKSFFSPIVLVTGIGVFIALYNYIDNNDRERKIATIEYFDGFYALLDKTDKKLLDTINFYGFKGSNYILGTDTLKEIIKHNSAYKIQLDKLMTFLNLYAISCQEGIFEEETAWAAYYKVITQSAKALIPYYEILEEERGRSRGAVCWFLRNMVRRWEIDNSFGRRFNKRIKSLNNRTEEIVKKYNVENKETVIVRQ